ncbi:hypothetical protein VNO78_25674 [Psophocarpus tetragonolobus]|uniref:Uncharacterized protein n=1 Tax=Psophocarpus tetragonolobus TaxID=3891 RepID=A0AAN9SA08_PSOTE
MRCHQKTRLYNRCLHFPGKSGTPFHLRIGLGTQHKNVEFKSEHLIKIKGDNVQGETLREKKRKRKSTNVRLLLKHTSIHTRCYLKFLRLVFVCHRFVVSVASLYFGSHIFILSFSLSCITLPFYPEGP